MGLDLYATHHQFLSYLKTNRVYTGICVEIPPGYEGQIRGRSRVAEHGLLIFPGTIDQDYRGEIVINCLPLLDSYRLVFGERIAQLVISPVARVTLVRGDLSQTERGVKGFGSTGA